MYIGNDLQVAFPSYRIIDDISGGFNGSQTSFALTVGSSAPVPFPINPQQCLLSVNGVIQKPDPTGVSGFNLVGGNIVFASAPTGGWSFFGVILAGADYVNVGANFPSGSASTPSITFDTDTDTGIYNSGANQVSIATAGVERFRVDSAGQLEAVSLGSAASPVFSFTTDTNTGIYSPGADQVAISTNGAQRVVIDSSGRLLVGTSTSLRNSALIQISGTSYPAIDINSFGTSTNPETILRQARGTQGSPSVVVNGDSLGKIGFQGYDGANYYFGATIEGYVDAAVTSSGAEMPARLVFSTTADGASSPTERMRISQAGFLSVGNVTSYTDRHVIQHPTQTQGNINLAVTNTAVFYVSAGGGANTAAASLSLAKNDITSRSINAGGTINASGADYAEYMIKAGDFTIRKGDICGITADGSLTLDYEHAVSFVVKSTNPSYVGGDTWGNEDAVGLRPDVEDADALAQWEAELEAIRQKVDRIAFAGQVPVNVMGATPGQYIVPVEASDGSIEGVAKDEAGLTLAEYMRAVGKVIAIENDGRARIIVKVA